MNILICTDGSSGSVQSADLISKLGFPKVSQITVLGVIDNKDDFGKLTDSMELIIQDLRTDYTVEKKILNGDPSEEILSEALRHKYDLVVVGGGGKQLGLLHPQLGSTTSKLARNLHTHFLVARNIPDKIRKILVCASTEASSTMTMNLGGEWISNTNAQLGLLHVLPLSTRKNKDEFISEPISKNSEQVVKIESDSVLIHAIQQLRFAGVKSEIISRIRQGLVVEEIISELKEGGYELLIIGAHYQPGQDRWQGTLLDDVTDQLLNRCSCSVLII
jgi:nucleotide-binding universal stress UspA family protein